MIKYMNSLHAELCEPQMKIAKFVYAMSHNIASPTMDFDKDKKSTKQLQERKESTKQSKRAIQESNNRTKRTSNSDTNDTDSVYSTESESNHTAHLPRPPSSPKPIRQHLQTRPVPCPRPSKSQQLINTKCIQRTRPSCIPIPKHTKSNSKTSHLSTSTHQQKPSMSTPKTSYLSTSTWPNTQTTVKQPTVPAPKTSTAFTYPQCIRKTPLLPTPPAPARNFNYRNHYKQHIPGPSPSRYNTYSTFSGPVTLNNYRYYLQPNISGPHTASPWYLHQGFFTRPYQQIPGHLIMQVPYIFTRPYQQAQGQYTLQVCYIPVLLLHPLQYYTAWSKKTEDTGYYKDISL